MEKPREHNTQIKYVAERKGDIGYIFNRILSYGTSIVRVIAYEILEYY